MIAGIHTACASIPPLAPISGCEVPNGTGGLLHNLAATISSGEKVLHLPKIPPTLFLTTIRVAGVVPNDQQLDDAMKDADHRKSLKKAQLASSIDVAKAERRKIHVAVSSLSRSSGPMPSGPTTSGRKTSGPIIPSGPLPPQDMTQVLQSIEIQLQTLSSTVQTLSSTVNKTLSRLDKMGELPL